jgi:hypothetical protein
VAGRLAHATKLPGSEDVTAVAALRPVLDHIIDR